MTYILKIVPRSIWSEAEMTGRFAGALIDVSDGFIHLSTTQQVEETAAKHFTGQADLLLVAVDPAVVADDLRWEPSREGALFPHLYAALLLEHVAWVRPLPLGANGHHDFSGLLGTPSR